MTISRFAIRSSIVTRRIALLACFLLMSACADEGGDAMPMDEASEDTGERSACVEQAECLVDNCIPAYDAYFEAGCGVYYWRDGSCVHNVCDDPGSASCEEFQCTPECVAPTRAYFECMPACEPSAEAQVVFEKELELAYTGEDPGVSEAWAACEAAE